MATKKITELPLINAISGSQVGGGSVLPVVVGGTTNQISPENFSRFINAYDAQTGSQNIFTQNQWFNAIVSASTINVGTLGVGGNTTIAGTLGVTGNGTIGGNLAVAGRITAEEFYTEITTASVIYASGSTKFGDDTTDTHEFTGSINVSGSVIYNGVILSNIDANTIQRLQQATASIQQATASLNTFTASQDDRNFTLSQVTGSFAGEIGGLEEYTASLKTAAIVSSSTQILNYNIFATTGSNTFRANQAITGSLSVSAGEFNVTTGSGNMTSSLIFDHTQNDGVTLGLRHNDRLSVADHTFNVNVWAAGVYTSFVRNGTPYSILNVEAFDNNNIYLYRDTRLYNKSLVIDNNLTVQKEVVIGSGSLSIQRGQFNAVTGSGALTSSLSFTHTEVDPITGNGTLELRYKNNQVGSENNAWKFVATDNGVQVRYDQYTTSNKMLFSVSSFGSNFDKLLIWRDVRLFGTGLAVDDSLLVKGVITGSLLATNGVVSSSNQLFELNQFTASQDSRNLTLSTVTGSLIGITNGLMAFTAALDNTYATDAQLYQLYQATRSLELHSGSMIGVTNGLMAYTASNTSLNTGLRGEVDGIEAYTASLKGQAIVSSSTQVQNYDVFALNSNLYTSTGSLIGITNGLMAFTAALDSTYATDAQLYQLYAETASIKAEIGGIEAYTASLKAASIVSSSTQVQNYDVFALNSNLYNGTGSIKGEIAGIEAYTASLKGAAIVSSSQQITNYYKFAETASANTFYGNQSIRGNAIINGGNSVRLYESTNTNYWDTYTYTDNTLRVNYNGAGGDEIILYNDGSINFSGAVTASGNISVGANSFTSPGGADKFIGVFSGQDSSIILQDSVETWEMYMNDDLYFTTGSTNPKNVMSLRRVTGNVEINEGNLVIGKAGKGIDFSITSNGSGTTSSELLNDYEEGTFTPTYTGTNLTVVTYGNQFGWYTKVGRLVTVTICLMTEDITVIGSENLKIGGLPFTSNSTAQASNALIIGDSSRWASNPPIAGIIQPNVTEVILYKDLGAVGAGTDPTTVKTSDLADATGNRNVVRATLTYFV